MARRRERVRLEDGLKLDLNKLVRDDYAKHGERRQGFISWRYTYSGGTVASGSIETELRAEGDGWVTLKVGKLEQTIRLRGEARHFGGLQWYFVCPALWRKGFPSCGFLLAPPGFRAGRPGAAESPTARSLRHGTIAPSRGRKTFAAGLAGRIT